MQVAPGVVTYGVVGRGYRAEAFLRLSHLLPDRFRVTGVATRDPAGAAEVTARWGVPAVVGVSELLDVERPDVVVTAVSWDANPGIVEELVRAEVPVLAETPPAGDLAALRLLWSAVGAGGLVQVAEQYALQPMNAARLAVVRDGLLGAPTSAHISMTQTYHAVSLLRAALGVAGEDVEVRATSATSPLANPLSRAGWSGDATPQDLTTTLAILDFEGDSGPLVGLYDFTETQTRNPLRTSRFLVRGTLGELVDDRVVRLQDPVTVTESSLVRRQTGQHRDFEVPDLEHISFDGAVVYRNDFYGGRLSDEEIAMATMLVRTAEWGRGQGPAPYPLAEAAQDQLLALAIGDAVRSGGAVRVPPEPWAAALGTGWSS